MKGELVLEQRRRTSFCNAQKRDEKNLSKQYQSTMYIQTAAMRIDNLLN